MSQRKFSPDVYVRLKETGLSNREIADQLGVDESSVRRGLRAGGFNAHKLPQWFIEEMAVHLDKPLVIDVGATGPGAVTADWHHPLTDYSLVNTFLDHAVDIGATNWLLVAGDWFNQDFWSQFDYKQPEAEIGRELRGSTETMKRVLDVFPEVVLTWGNHDARLHKVLKYATEFRKTMEWLFSDLSDDERARLHISNLDHAVVKTPRGPYYVAHPQSYNSVPLTTAIALAAKEQMHVITGHSHHTALGHDKSGQFTVAEIGGFFDASKTRYLQRTTKYPKWTQGYGFIDAEGYLIIEGQGWSSRMGRRAA